MSEEELTPWKRPRSVPYPIVWRRFDGERSDRDYWVMDITDEYVDEIIEILSTGFVKEELFAKLCDVSNREDVIEDLKNMWREGLEQKVGLMCMCLNTEGKTTLVGFNLTYVVSRIRRPLQNRGLTDARITGILEYAYKLRDPYEVFQTDEFMGTLGLYVLPQYRKDSVGTQILRARENLARAVGMRATLSIFTTVAAQRAAEKAGFLDFVQLGFDELERINPEFSFSKTSTVSTTSKTLRLMFRLYI